MWDRHLIMTLVYYQHKHFLSFIIFLHHMHIDTRASFGVESEKHL